MKIREMRIEDAVAVSNLSGQLGEPATVTEIQKRFSEISDLRSIALFVACDENNDVVGWVEVNRERPTLMSDGKAEVHALVVDEKVRSKGVGALLVDAAEQWAKNEGLTLMRIRSNIIRVRAHNFYIRQGYKIKKSWHLFTKTLNS